MEKDVSLKVNLYFCFLIHCLNKLSFQIIWCLSVPLNFLKEEKIKLKVIFTY